MLAPGATPASVTSAATSAALSDTFTSHTTGAAALDSDTMMLVGADTKGERTGLRARWRHVLHATWVVTTAGAPVTHQAIRGEVAAVSDSSITIKARDGVSLTFAVSADTHVRARSQGAGADGAIGAVTVGARALVTGVGASDPVAKHVVFLR